MPVTYTLHADDGYIETRCVGPVRLPDVLHHFRELEANPALPARLDVLLDVDQVTTVPRSAHLREVTVAVDRLTHATKWGACAVVAGSDAMFGMSRVFEAFTEGLFAQIRVFRNRGEALVWLAERRAGGLPDLPRRPSLHP